MQIQKDRTLMRKLKILAVFIALSACRAHYQSPDAENVTILHIHNDSDRRLSAYHFKDFENCSGGVEIISSANILPRDEIQIKVPADKGFSFLVDWISPLSFSATVARVPITFSPRVGREYDFTFRVSGAEYSTFLTYRGPDGSMPDPTFRIRELKSALLPGDPFC